MSIDLVNVTSAALIDWFGSAISGSSMVSVAVVDCILADVIRSRYPRVIHRIWRWLVAGAVAAWAVHLYVVMVGRTPDQMYLAGNV